MRNRFCASGPLGAMLIVMMTASSSVAQPPSTSRAFIEHVITKPKLPEGGLGTVAYAPSPEETPFYEELAEAELVTGSDEDEYDITNRDEKYVSWFGIVREISEDKTKNQTVLAVEHKYFDGLTDTHIMAVSFNGSGDFQVIVPGTGRNIEPLSLVRVYGVVAASQEKVPRIVATFIRDWHWEAFTFIGAYGRQRGSEKWRTLNQVDLDDIYDPLPDVSYYRLRLGDRPEDIAWKQAFRERLLKTALASQPEAEPRWTAFVEAFCSRNGEKLDEAFEDVYQARAFETLSAVLTAALKEGDAEIRNRAVALLGDLEEFGASAVPALIEALNDDNERVRANVVGALGSIGEPAVSAAPAIVKLLKDSDPAMRAVALEALGWLNAPAEEMVPPLIDALQDSDAYVRFLAAGALGDVGQGAAAAVEPLIKLLQQDDDENVQWEAAWAIGRVDADGRLGVPALAEALKTSEIPVRRFAALGLAALGAKAAPALPQLAPLLNDGDSGVRVAAAEAIWKAGGDRQQAVQVLNAILSSGNGQSPMWAADVIAEMGENGRAALPGLQQALKSRNSNIRPSAVVALGKLGGAAAEAVPDLVKLLDDRDELVRVLSAESLWRINQHPEAIPRLLKELQTESPGQSYAATALGKIGTPAAEAIPLLKELRYSPDQRTRTEAKAALQKLESLTDP